MHALLALAQIQNKAMMFNENDQKEVIMSTRKILDLPVITNVEEKNYNELKKELSEYLDHLITTDFNKLIGILYRIDISQEKATSTLANNIEKETPGESLADLIIARQFEKIETRKKYRNYLKDSGDKDSSQED